MKGFKTTAIKTLAALATATALTWPLAAAAGELRFWTWRNEDKAAYAEFFKDFNKQHPDVKITFEAFEPQNYPTVLSTAMAGDKGPDVMMVRAYGAFEAVARPGYLQELNDTNVPGLSKFPEAALKGQTLRADGKIYAVPFATQTMLIIYNTEVFAKAGVKPPETVVEMLEAAKKLHNAEPNMAGMCWNGQRGTPLGQAFIQILGSFGQPPIDEPKKGEHDFDISDLKPENMHPLLDTPKALQVAQLMKDLVPYSPPGVLNMAWGDSYNTMAAGGCAMGYVWSGYTGTWENDPNSPARGKMAYIPHPRGPDVAVNRSPLGGWYLGIPKNIDPARLQLAWNALVWLSSAEMMEKYTQHGDCVAPRSSVSNNAGVIERCPAVKAVNDFATAGQIVAWQRPPIPQIQLIYDTLGTEMHQMLTGKKTPEEAVKASQSIVDRQMRKDGVY